MQLKNNETLVMSKPGLEIYDMINEIFLKKSKGSIFFTFGIHDRKLFDYLKPTLVKSYNKLKKQDHDLY